MSKKRHLSLVAVLLLAGCASTETVSPDLTVNSPSAADTNAKWTFSSRTRWGDPVRISISVNGSPLAAVAEPSPGDIIGIYQGHVIRAQCKTEWHSGAAFGSGSCYVYVDGTQAGILLL